MDEKKLPKETLAELMSMTQRFYQEPYNNEGLLAERIDLARSIFEELSIRWSWLLDLIDGVYKFSVHDAHESLYKVLEVLGWTVE